MLDAGFVETMKTDAGSLLELDCDANAGAVDIVAIVARGLDLRPAAGWSVVSQENSANDEGQSRHATS